MYSTHKEGKSVVTEKFIRSLKNKIYKYMTSTSKNVDIDNLAVIVNKYNNTYHNTIKMKPAVLKSITNLDFNKDNKKDDPKFEVDDHDRISKSKNIFANDYIQNWFDEFFVIKEVKNTVPWTYVISDIIGEEIVEPFYKKELQKTNQKEFRVEKVIKRKDDKLYVTWKGCDNSFNSWIDKKDIV